MKRVFFYCINMLLICTLTSSAQNAGDKAEKPATHSSRDKMEFRKALIADRSKPAEKVTPTPTPSQEANLINFFDGACHEDFISTLSLDKSKQTLIQKAIGESLTVCDGKLFAPAKSEVLSQKNDIYLPGVPVADFDSITKQLEAKFLTFLSADVTARLVAKWQNEASSYFCREILLVYITDSSTKEIESIVIYQPVVLMVSLGGQWSTVSFYQSSLTSKRIWDQLTIKDDGSRTGDEEFIQPMKITIE